MGSSVRIRGRRFSLPDVIHIAILKPAEVSSEISAGFFAFLSSKRLPDLQWKVTGGDPNMTNEQKAVIRRLRQQNNSYVSIANTLGVSVSAVKGYCQRNGLTGLRAAAESTPDDPSVCLGCGKPITQREGIKRVKFCCPSCRQAWWNSHPEKVNRKAIYSFTCACCGKPFTAYGNRGRKYCSHECYITDRFKGGEA
jgi:hypothetical protein